MEREKPNFDVLGTMERERLARGWSEYALAERAEIAQSTISTWRRKGLQPNLASIEKICTGLGISLSQFFGDSADGLTDEQREIFDLWRRLSPAQRTAVKTLLESFLN